MSLHEHIWTVYEGVWAEAQRLGIRIAYTGMAPDNEAGWFEIMRSGDPKIVIVRPYYMTSPQPSRIYNNERVVADAVLEGELLTMAHEFGHYWSWRQGQRPADLGEVSELFFDALHNGAKLSRANADKIYEEEQRAWQYARDLLAKSGYQHWSTFDERVRVSLKAYRERFAQTVSIEASELR